VAIGGVVKVKSTLLKPKLKNKAEQSWHQKGKRKVARAKKIIQKDGTSGHWKKLIKHKTCSFCTNEAMHYEKFKYYCKHCYKEKLNGK
jgi:hypothetical protein